MMVNYYYSSSLSSGAEGDLVQLCQDHAEEFKDQVTWAGMGDEESACEIESCNMKNNLAPLNLLPNLPTL